MKKGIIITGEAGSGKTTLARQIALEAGGNAVIISGRCKPSFFNNPFVFGICTKDTKVIIIDSVFDTDLILSFIPIVLEPIKVNAIHEKSFIINPLVIITCDEPITREDVIKKLGKSFRNYFLIMECKKAEPITPECPHAVIFKDRKQHICGKCGKVILDKSNYQK